VVKFGGSSIGGMEQIDVFAAEIAELMKRGLTPVILHGGGPEITEEMKRCGLPVKKVAGLRITDDATLQIAKSVLSASTTAWSSLCARRALKASEWPEAR